MTRELDPQQAYQIHCLAQMGVTSWLSGEQDVTGQVYWPDASWSLNTPANVPMQSVSEHAVRDGFEANKAKSPDSSIPHPPESKSQSVNNLREQLHSGPEVIVEDLQPIEELAVDIDVPSEQMVDTSSKVTRIHLRLYALEGKLLILTEVPGAFSEEVEIERLALNMGQALLGEPIQEWEQGSLSWPGKLTNPHFLTRSDWLLGAFESLIDRFVKNFSRSPMVVVAGAKLAQLMDELPQDSPITQYSRANIVSLPELYRIPELRKDAWQSMQKSLS